MWTFFVPRNAFVQSCCFFAEKIFIFTAQIFLKQ